MSREYMPGDWQNDHEGRSRLNDRFPPKPAISSGSFLPIPTISDTAPVVPLSWKRDSRVSKAARRRGQL